MRQDPIAESGQRPANGLAQQSFDKVPVASINEELERILASPAFAQSQRLSRFLRFTVEQFIQGEGDKLKEYHLGTAVFDKDETFDPRTDPIVRVEAGRLRAKLREYYDKDGRNDPISIDLPKGGYVPIIQKRPSPGGKGADAAVTRAAVPRRTVLLVAALLLAALSTFWASLEFRQNQALRSQMDAAKSQLPSPEFSPVWRPFVAPGSKNFAIFGSPIFFADPQHKLFVRSHLINDTANLPANPQFRALQDLLGPLSAPRYDYTLMRDAVALHRLTSFLVRSGASLTALAAHESVWDSIQDGNIIFLGAPRMNPLMRRLPVQEDFEWDADQNIRNRRPQPGEQEIYSTPSHEDVMSYAVIASFPGLRPNREILLLVAQGGSGTQAAVDYVTQLETVRAMNEKLQLGDKGERIHYQMLLRVFVDKGAPVKSEYVTHHLIP